MSTSLPEFWYEHGEQTRARKVRLVAVQNAYRQGRLTPTEARQILAGPLMPWDESSVIDDSQYAEWAGIP